MTTEGDVRTWDAPDRTRWVYSPGLDIWTGWIPGEDGCWTLSPAEMDATYPTHPAES